MEEAVVTFKNADRVISMYFTEVDGALNMQMSISPDFNKGDEPDMPIRLASIFMEALKVENEDNRDDEPKIITN